MWTFAGLLVVSILVYYCRKLLPRPEDPIAIDMLRLHHDVQSITTTKKETVMDLVTDEASSVVSKCSPRGTTITA